MNLDTARSARVLALLDEVIELPARDREAWLADVAHEDPESGALLCDLLHAIDTGSADGFLETRDLIRRQLAAAVPDDVAPGKQFGAYRLLQPIGYGGMGAVWLAERADGLFTRRVALKLVHASVVGSAAGERFTREREILAALNHPHITRLLDAGFADDGQPYLALEYVDGTPLTDWCDRERCTVRSRLDLFQQVLSAVQYAHANLVVHRDLKPTNILVTPDAQVRLLDFGIAKLLRAGEAHETALTQVAGRALTLAYASPEQIAGRPITTASDVYSLGVLLYELLCGRRPYRLDRISAGALEEAILSAHPGKASHSAITDDTATARGTTTRKLRQMLAGDLDTIIGKALKKEPAERYATVEAFAQDLRRSVAGEPVLARPDGRWYRARKTIARHRLAAVASLLVVCSLATGAGVATWQAIQARAERARAERVKEFIGSIFASANPYVSGKSNVTARDVLDAGVDRVTRELAGDPAIEAELLSVLSGSYHNLGEVDRALASSRSAYALADGAFPQEDATRARIIRVLAEATYAKGNTEEAAALIERAVAIQRHLGTAAESELAQSLRVLSDVVGDRGLDDESIALAREAMAVSTRARGGNDPFTIELMGELSNRLMIALKRAEALDYAERAYRAAVKVYGHVDHPSVVLQLTNYAYALDANGRFLEARDGWQRVVEFSKRTFNQRGPQVSQALYGLARSQERLGELKVALDTFRESLDATQGYGANVNGESASRYFAIGRVELEMRQPRLALEALADAIDQGTKAFGAQSSRVHDAENLRAAALIYDGDLAEADRLVTRRTAEDRSSSAPSLSAALQCRALLERARGNDDASVESAEEAWRLTSASTNATVHAVAAASSDLGRAQLDARNVDGADASLQRAILLYGQVERTATPQQADAWVAMGRVKLARSRVDDAVDWLERATNFWAEFDASNPSGGEASYWLAIALQTKHDDRHAREQLAHARVLLARSTWPMHRSLLNNQ